MSAKTKKTILSLGIIVATLIGVTFMSTNAFAAVAAPNTGVAQSAITQPAPNVTTANVSKNGSARSQNGLLGEPFFNPFFGGFNPFFGGFNPFLFGGFNPFLFDNEEFIE